MSYTSKEHYENDFLEADADELVVIARFAAVAISKRYTNVTADELIAASWLAVRSSGTPPKDPEHRLNYLKSWALGGARKEAKWLSSCRGAGKVYEQVVLCDELALASFSWQLRKLNATETALACALIEGYTQNEIAKSTGQSRAKVQRRVDYLRKLIKDLPEPLKLARS